MHRRIAKTNHSLPLSVAGIATVVGLAFVLVSLVQHFDAVAQRREEAVVANGLVDTAEDTAQRLAPQTVWDDAVINLDNHFDEVWAEDNIGRFLHNVGGFTHAFVLDARNRVIFASKDGAPDARSGYEAFAPIGQSLVQKVRDREKRKPHQSGSVPEPIQASAFADVGDELFIVSASLVQPDFGRARITRGKAPIVVTAMPLGYEFQQQFAHRFLLNELHVHEGLDTRSEPDEAHIPIRSDAGEIVATMDWKPEKPGQALLMKIGLPIILVVSVLSAVMVVLYRRTRRMAESLMASEARATHLAFFDTLTGLPNRARFMERLEQALDHLRRDASQPVAVHCIDLDRFKEINDLHGHQIGDQLIKLAARRLIALCRSTDTLARITADEFALIQTGATAAQAAALSARLIEAMEPPFYLETNRAFISCSIGITLVTDGHLEPGEAVRQADMALGRAKADGASRYAFYEIEMDSAVKTRRSLEADLRDALINGGLEMAYQPQVNQHGAMCGVEALVRWRHPVRGVISPGFFVPIAEECGLIGQLGMFTLRRAFEDGRRWKDLKVAVNVSAGQLREPGFVRAVAALVGETRIDPRRFELEITEGLLVGDDPETHESLRQLRELGFTLALDDFGTGYSSLSYLTRFPINKIKIDRAFIVNLGVDRESEAVIGAIVRLARAMKLKVIAEGVETEDQRDRLAAVGCREIQGYLYSEPVSASRIETLRSVARIAPRTAHAA